MRRVCAGIKCENGQGGGPALAATLKAPFLKSDMVPSKLRVPSGKNKTDAPFCSSSRHSGGQGRVNPRQATSLELPLQFECLSSITLLPGG
jgi:hypothetical protein